MGCCCAQTVTLDHGHQLSFDTNSTNSKSVHKSIQKHLKDNEKEDSRIIKMLLLGAGSSGKSTLFRQIESIHGDNYAYNDDGNAQYFTSLGEIKHDIKTNCLLSITKLLKKSYDLSIEPYNFVDCKVDTNNENITNAIKIISHESKRNIIQDMDSKCPNLSQVGECIAFIWSLPGIKNTFTKRQYFSLIENIDYFFDKIQDIMDDEDEYVPNRQDVLLSRIRTTGILKRQYKIQETIFHMYDVGGQRSERKKWISLFDNVDALIFVVALNGFCSVIFEDETVNKMQESLLLFGKQCNSSYFTQKTQFILFLNKNDLFKERLQANMTLSLCFGDKWDGPNYSDKEENEFKDGNDKNEWFTYCYNKSIEFITKAFLSQNENPKIASIFTHITTATDQDNIQTVFNDVRTGIIQRNLAKIGVAYGSGTNQNNNFA